MVQMNERKAFADLLFDGGDIELLNIKFLRGELSSLTAEDFCATARKVVEDFWQQGGPMVDQPPTGRKPQRSVAEVLAAY